MIKLIRKKLWNFLLILPILFNLSGCVYLVVGGIGALGGYIVSPDTIEGIAETDALTLWDEAIDVVSVMGLIVDQQEDAGIIKAKINRADVTITINSINTSTTKLSVKARKTFLPKVSLAQDIYIKIMSRVSEE